MQALDASHHDAETNNTNTYVWLGMNNVLVKSDVSYRPYGQSQWSVFCCHVIQLQIPQKNTDTMPVTKANIYREVLLEFYHLSKYGVKLTAVCFCQCV